MQDPIPLLRVIRILGEEEWFGKEPKRCYGGLNGTKPDRISPGWRGPESSPDGGRALEQLLCGS
jgi:hypothetical protein